MTTHIEPDAIFAWLKEQEESARIAWLADHTDTMNAIHYGKIQDAANLCGQLVRSIVQYQGFIAERRTADVREEVGA